MCEYFMTISILKNEDKKYEKKIEYYESLLKNGVRMSDFIIYQNEIKSLIYKRIFLKLLEFVIIKKMLEEKRKVSGDVEDSKKANKNED